MYLNIDDDWKFANIGNKFKRNLLTGQQSEMDMLRFSCTLAFLLSTTTICQGALDAPCTNANECDDVDNAECTGADGSKVCKCLPTFKPGDQNTGTCVARACTNDECVDVNNAVCTEAGGSKVCTCLPTFKPDASSGGCVAIVLGDTCTDDGGECADIANSECVDDGGLKCKCKGTHKEDDGSCVPKVLGDTCTGDVECADIADSKCIDVGDGALKCICKATHKPVEGSCVAKGLGDSCQADSDCNTDDAICGSTSEKCECDADFVEESGTCKVAVDGDCSNPNSEKCVGNAECNDDKCACATNYVPVDDFCVPENGSRGNLASFLVVILSLTTFFQFKAT